MEWTNLTKVLNEYGEELSRVYQQTLTKQDNVASRNLIDNVTYNVKLGDNKIVLSLNLQDYYKYIENGTRPHWAPIQPLKDWVSVKFNLPEPEGISMAYAVQHKIAKYGTQAYKPLANSVEELKEKYDVLLWEAADKDINEDVDAFIFQYFHNSK